MGTQWVGGNGQRNPEYKYNSKFSWGVGCHFEAVWLGFDSFIGGWKLRRNGALFGCSIYSCWRKIYKKVVLKVNLILTPVTKRFLIDCSGGFCEIIEFSTWWVHWSFRWRMDMCIYGRLLESEGSHFVLYQRDLITSQHGGGGGMPSVGLRWEEALALCPPSVYPACHNAADNVTLAGSLTGLAKFLEVLKAKGIFTREVPTGGMAFHSTNLLTCCCLKRYDFQGQRVHRRPEQNSNQSSDGFLYRTRNAKTQVNTL